MSVSTRIVVDEKDLSTLVVAKTDLEKALMTVSVIINQNKDSFGVIDEQQTSVQHC